MLIQGHTRTDVDRGAQAIGRMARMARSWAPLFAACGESYPILGSDDAGPLGAFLPGVGVLLGCDLKQLGVTRPIAHVYERSSLLAHAERLARGLRDRESWKCNIGSLDDLTNARSGTSNVDDPVFSKIGFAGTAASWSSWYQAAGFPGTGTYTAIPGGAVMTIANSLVPVLSNPPAGKQRYLLGWGFLIGAVNNASMLVDLLVGAGGISSTITTAQTINSVALTRYTSGVGVMMTFDVTTALGATASNLTVSYTNQLGVVGQSTGAQAMSTSAVAQRLQPAFIAPMCPLAAGDLGVQSVQTCTFSANMGAGAVALNLYKPLSLYTGAGTASLMLKDANLDISCPQPLATDASNVLGCPMLFTLVNTTPTGSYFGYVRTALG